jgi:hypothetical protein
MRMPRRSVQDSYRYLHTCVLIWLSSQQKICVYLFLVPSKTYEWTDFFSSHQDIRVDLFFSSQQDICVDLFFSSHQDIRVDLFFSSQQDICVDLFFSSHQDIHTCRLIF